jgi:predicted transcriptional regulator of viral defense system
MSLGRYYFTTEEAMEDTGDQRTTVLAALRRLRGKGLVTSPARSFWVIVPPEYRTLECLPAEQFVPGLVQHFAQEHYYAGLLTAAAYHGAAHQRPQVFQVVLRESREALRCGRVRIQFVGRKNVAKVPTQSRNTKTGVLEISTPEATAVDLVGYAEQCGGLDNVATVLTELAEELAPDVLAELAPSIAPDAWVQRLGYLLDLVGAEEVAAPLHDWVEAHVDYATPLAPGEERMTGMPRDGRWKVAVNTEVEPDI